MPDVVARYERVRRNVAGACAVTALSVGLLVLVGWAADIASLKSVLPGLATMKANTALAFTLAGLSLGCLSAKGRTVGFGCAAAVVAVAVLTLVQYTFSLDLGIDQLLFREPPGSVATSFPGRMAPITALVFLLIGLALLLFLTGHAPLVAQAISGLAILVSFFCCLSYLYGADSLRPVAPFSSVALHTAVTFLLLGVGVLAASPARGVVGLLVSDGVGGVVARRMLPVVVVIPVLFGWLRLAAQRAGLVGAEFGLSLFALSNITVFTALVFWTASRLQRYEAKRTRAEESLRQSERRQRELLEGVPQLIWTCLPDGRCDFLSRQWVEYTGIPEADQLGFAWSEAVHPDDRSHLMERWTQAVSERKPLDVEFRIRGGSGEYRWFKTRGVLLREQDGSSKWFGTNTDIHDKKLVESELKELNTTLERRVEERTKALREEEERFRSAFDHAPSGIALVAPGGKWLRVNQSLCEILGYTEAELLATDFQSITHSDDLALNLDYYQGMLAGTIRTYQMEKRYLHKAGHFVYATLSVSLVRDGDGEPLYFISQVKDITQWKQAEAQLKASLREKEVMLKEIHHRVKNNLQIVSTLLDLQSEHTQDRQAIEMFEESRGRVKSMALIHERLYRSQDLARVNIADYVRQLAEDLFHAYRVSNDEIVLHVDVTVPPLPIDIAIPCGLLLNELLSNCLKHAFADASEGWIRVTLHDDGPNTILTVADNGAGFPPDFDFRNTTSFGLQLVTTLVEQLHGEIELKTEGGSEFIVSFPVKDRGPNGTLP